MCMCVVVAALVRYAFGMVAAHVHYVFDLVAAHVHYVFDLVTAHVHYVFDLVAAHVLDHEAAADSPHNHWLQHAPRRLAGFWYHQRPG